MLQKLLQFVTTVLLLLCYSVEADDATVTYYYGKECTYNEECGDTGNLICQYGYCQCPPLLPYHSVGTRCKQFLPDTCEECGEFGAQCYSGEDCRGDLDCVDSKCSCPDLEDTYIGNGTCTVSKEPTWCQNRQRRCIQDANCPFLASCLRGCCSLQTVNPYLMAHGGGEGAIIFLNYGDKCSASSQCPEGMICNYGYCQCPSNAPYNLYDGRCSTEMPNVCVACAEYNAVCYNDLDCRGELACIDETCKCPYRKLGYAFNKSENALQRRELSNYLGRGVCSGRASNSNKSSLGLLKRYGQTCEDDSQCGGDLLCLKTVCRCPEKRQYIVPGSADQCQANPTLLSRATASHSYGTTFSTLVIISFISATTPAYLINLKKIHFPDVLL